MSGSEENSIGPDSRTIISPNRVQGARALASSRGVLAAQPESQQPEVHQRDGAHGHRESQNVEALQNREGQRDSFSGFSKAINMVHRTGHHKS